ncbi:Uncharacterized protein YjgR [hydrothermal vent metagenome]|uniref:Uncharacterized protein YjgR n=1 Tax=hydrothermal vent metagenome TaxID=652676 RepID=A0A3B0TBK4_9ZZZZ
MVSEGQIYLGTSVKPEVLNLKLANRHGLIAGATGTGKTVTLQILAEGFSAAGVPVFAADVKGDLSGLAVAGTPKDFLEKRAETIGFDDYSYEAMPVAFWDLFGEQGHPIRTTISEMGPLLLSRMLDLNDTQEGVLTIAFRIADDEGMALLDLKDLRAMLVFVAEQASEISSEYGNVSRASVGAIQRRLLTLEDQGGAHFFGEPALDIRDFMRTTRDGRGMVNILAADRLMSSPRLYATFLLWLLSELFEELPEVGNPDKPKLVFFFDEAHLLFDEAPRALIKKVEQVVRLIRSKGVGVYFVTQNPLDVPDTVLSQLGNRVQHALRAFTPRDQKAVRAAATTFRQNPELDVTQVISELGVGEALVSTLEKKGVPSVVQRTLIRPPSSRLGPIEPGERRKILADSPLSGLYDEEIDRVSAYEKLKKRAERAAARQAELEAQAERDMRRDEGGGGLLDEILGGNTRRTGSRSSSRRRSSRGRRSDTVMESVTKSVVRSIGSSFGRQIGRALIRGILGSLSR